jgi:uncharacterized membrane protein (DUF2068 family)
MIGNVGNVISSPGSVALYTCMAPTLFMFKTDSDFKYYARRKSWNTIQKKAKDEVKAICVIHCSMTMVHSTESVNGLWHALQWISLLINNKKTLYLPWLHHCPCHFLVFHLFLNLVIFHLHVVHNHLK